MLLFDRTRSLSLHLFEHVHGESRDRGQAMIDLKALYEKNGLAISATELPDFLPLFLEYLSTRPLAEAAEMLGQTAHISRRVAERLAQTRLALRGGFPRARRDRRGKAQGRGRRRRCCRSRIPIRPISPRSIGPGRTSRSPSARGGGCKDGLVARIRAARRPPALPEA